MIFKDRPSQTDWSARLRLLQRRAGLALVWERIWPPIASLVYVFALFVIASWLGVWLELSLWGRIIGLSCFGLLTLICLFYLLRLRFPSHREALARLDRDSGLVHRPASSLSDVMVDQNQGEETKLLWELHLNRARAASKRLKVAWPSPRLADRDRLAVRALLAVCVFASAFVAGPEKYSRLLAAFNFSTPGTLAQSFRLDAWIDPPPYTGRPPILLNTKDDLSDPLKEAARKLEAPLGSSIIVRSSQASNVIFDIEGELSQINPEEDKTKNTANQSGKSSNDAEILQENRWTLRGNGKLTIRRSGRILGSFDIASIPDLPPVIELKGDPQPNARGSLTLNYKISDDYGVIGAEAEFADPRIGGRPIKGRSLVEAPHMGLILPNGPGGLGEGETTTDLSEHPWAGARVKMTLTARDEGANIGRSESVEMILPQRVFVKPLARALVEQRRNLVLAPDERARVAAAMEALQIAPERFKTTAAIYLGFNTISRRLGQAKTDQDLLGVADFMWEMALRIEDGDLPEAERDLRAAQQQLREALQRGATEEEIRKLTEQLRAAMDKFLRQLAEQMRQNQNGQQQAENQNQQNPQDRMISPQDLQSMLDRMEEMAKSGNLADAQRMLDQLQNLLENLQNAKRGSGQDQMSAEMNRQMNELDKLMREQQQLRDKTFNDSQKPGEKKNSNKKKQQKSQRNQQDQKQQSQKSPQSQSGEPQQDEQESGDDQDEMSGDNGEGEGDDDLQGQQEDLRKRLEDLQRAMKQLGMKGNDGLDEAEQAMKDAEQSLGQGQGGQGKAVDAQGRALDALRRGAQSMAEQMQQMMQQQGQGGNPGGQGNPNGPMRQGNNNGNSDPLGRESHDKGDNSRSLYDPLGTPAAQRAQKVLEELRRRLSDPTRPQEEIDYLERLLKRY